MIVFQRICLIAIFALTFGAVSCSDAEPTPKPSQSPPSTPTPPTTPTTPPTPPVKEIPQIEMPPAEKPAEDDPAELATRGKAVYTANCIACHNTQPELDGAIGPAIAGASFELIEARVMRNEYPEGYTPKRDTKAMIALPYLEKDLAALVAYLAE